MPIVLTPIAEKLIRSGFMQVPGRDRNFRPIIILRPRILQAMKPEPLDGIKGVAFVQEYIKDFIMLKGQIENWVIIFDLDGLGLFNLPYKVSAPLA